MEESGRGFAIIKGKIVQYKGVRNKNTPFKTTCSASNLPERQNYFLKLYLIKNIKLLSIEVGFLNDNGSFQKQFIRAIFR